jgi:hypothetical protein
MRAGISFLILIVVSTGAFAEDKNNQANVYNEFRQWMKPHPEATVDEEVTARIKRHMANFLPSGHDFVCSTRAGREVSRANYRLAEANGSTTDWNVNVRSVRSTGKSSSRHGRSSDWRVARQNVSRPNNGEWLSTVGTGTTDDRANPLSHPINITRIWCLQSSGTCELSTAEFSPEDSQLYFSTPFDYSITAWGPTRVTATSEHPCGTALLSIDIPTKSVRISSVPHSDLSFCSKEGPTTWRLADDGFPIIWKIHQEKANQARALVYAPARRVVPPVVDAFK